MYQLSSSITNYHSPIFFTNTYHAYLHQIPDIKTGSDRVDAVVIDEESVGSLTAPGCGGKILRGDGALEQYLAKMKDSAV